MRMRILTGLFYKNSNDIMPGMDGFEVLASIRSDKETADIPVIFLTADDDSKRKQEGWRRIYCFLYDINI